MQPVGAQLSSQLTPILFNAKVQLIKFAAAFAGESNPRAVPD
jgi:hypothetical protein